jgi:hypothetical protein
MKALLAIGVLALAGAAASAPAKTLTAGCADHWQVEVDGDSFAHNGAGRTFTPAALAAFRTKVQAALKIAAADACRGMKVAPARAASIHRVRVFSASGASEPHFYSAAKGTLNFEWVFAEEGLAVPPRATMVGGLVCWANPSERMCAEEGD